MGEITARERRTSPKVVVAVSWKVMVTVLPDEPPLPLLVPVPVAPVWMATALRAATVALNEPLATVYLECPEDM